MEASCFGQAQRALVTLYKGRTGGYWSVLMTDMELAVKQNHG